MVYQYVAYNDNLKVIKGRLSATSEEVATNLLSSAGYRILYLRPLNRFRSLDRLQARLFRIKPAEMILFNRQLALLLESGINITSSLELLQNQASNHPLKKVLGEVISDLRGGSQLSAALGKHPEIFPPIYCRLLGVGEQTGSLETMLRQIADDMEKQAATVKSIKNALMYPAIASIVTIMVVGILVTFVIPAFGNLYSSLGAELPLLTRLLLDIARKLQSYGTYLLLAIFTATGLAFAYVRTPAGKHKLDKLTLRLPLVGRVKHLNELARSCRNISLLYDAGLPLTEIIPQVIQSSDNTVLAKALSDVREEMIKGEGLSQPMAKNPFFLPMMVQMVKVGEETGNLNTALSAVAKSYETEAEDRTHSLIGLIQPVMTLIIAVVVGLIALSLISAMYSIYGQVL